MGFFVIVCIILVTYLILDWLFHLPKVQNFKFKYIVVTECGSSGGQSLALHLHGLGFHVFAGCPNEGDKDVLAELKSPRLMPAVLDVTSEESVKNFLDFVKWRLPDYAGIWALVNNAQILGNTRKTENLTTQDYLKVFDVNLLGTVDMTRTFLPLIRKARGRFVNTSSVFGRLSYQYAPFSASSYGIEAFSDVLRQEVYRQGIDVSIIEPALVRRGENPGSQITDYSGGNYEAHDHHGRDEHRRANQNSLIKAYTHAVTASLPRTRYVIGWHAKLITRSLCLLPDFITDRVIQAAMRSSS